jgi:hypothetical protein
MDERELRCPYALQWRGSFGPALGLEFHGCGATLGHCITLALIEQPPSLRRSAEPAAGFGTGEKPICAGRKKVHLGRGRLIDVIPARGKLSPPLLLE